MYTPFQDGAVATPTRRRVLIVDDHRFFSSCLRMLLDAQSDFEVCDVTTTATDLEARIEHFRPDVLLIDLTLGTESGLRVGQQLRAMEIATPILFMSTMRTLTAEQLATVPASAFAAKSKTPAHFVRALRTLLRESPTGGELRKRALVAVSVTA